MLQIVLSVTVQNLYQKVIIFALVQYQHIIFALLLFCSESSCKKQIIWTISVVFLNLRLSNLRLNYMMFRSSMTSYFMWQQFWHDVKKNVQVEWDYRY